MHGDGSEFPGARVDPDDPRYPALVRGFNQRWVGRPRFVQVVGDAQQVVAIVQRCVDEKLRLTARSGGHCYEGWVSENDGVIVDVSSLRAAGRDATNGWYYLDSGCTNWDLYNQLYRQYGVTLPAGSCYSVGRDARRPRRVAGADRGAAGRRRLAPLRRALDCRAPHALARSHPDPRSEEHTS